MAALYKIPKSRFWLARYRDAAGKQRMVSTKIEHSPAGKDSKERAQRVSENRRLAQDIAAKLEAAERGNPTENHLREVLSDISARLTTRALDFPTTRKYLLEWLEARNLSEGTATRYRKPIAGFIESLGTRADLPMTNVTPSDVDAFASARLKGGIAPSTVSVDVKALNVPFNAATRAGLIPWNPVARAQPIEAVKEQRQPFTRAEVEALLEACPSTEWKTVVMLGALAGLRFSDATALRWENVDLFAGTISFRPKKTERKKRDLVLPMAARMKAHLLTLERPKDGKGFISPGLASKRTSGKSGLSMAFARIMERAGIDRAALEGAGGGRTFNRKSFHSLRHFFVSELERRGVAPDLRMKLSGHTTAAAHGRYTHTELETLASAVKGL